VAISLPFLFAITSNHQSTKNYRPIPGGFAHESCINAFDDTHITIDHDKEDEHLIVTLSNGDRINIPHCPFPFFRNNDRFSPYHGEAWKTYAQYETSGTPVTSLTGQWTVPPQPTQADSQILYFWNGIEPTDNSQVLQPVLQWGATPAGGGNYWGIASWYVGSGGVAVSSLIATNTGDVITGTMNILSNGTWEVRAAVGSHNSTLLSVTPNEKDYVYAYEVLEAYTLSSCQDYPPTGVVAFTEIAVEVGGSPVTPTWTPMQQQPITCNEITKVISTSAVDITFSTS